jgi:hypothetical protein
MFRIVIHIPEGIVTMTTNRKKLCKSLFSLITVIVASTHAHGRQYIIALDGTGDFNTIQAAIDVAADGDEIVIHDGVYTGNGNRDISFAGKAITVRSLNGPDACIIDCEELGRAFEFSNGETSSSELVGMTLVNGRRNIGGGCLLP